MSDNIETIGVKKYKYEYLLKNPACLCDNDDYIITGVRDIVSFLDVCESCEKFYSVDVEPYGIIFDPNFNESIVGMKRFDYLQYIKFCGIDNKKLGEFNQNIENKLPNELTILELINTKFNNSVNKLPKSLKCLKIVGGIFNNTVNKLPESLNYLYLDGEFNQNVDQLPKGIKILILNGKFNKNIDKLPDSVELLALGKYFNQIVKKWPANLKRIFIHKNAKISGKNISSNIIVKQFEEETKKIDKYYNKMFVY